MRVSDLHMAELRSHVECKVKRARNGSFVRWLRPQINSKATFFPQTRRPRFKAVEHAAKNGRLCKWKATQWKRMCRRWSPSVCESIVSFSVVKMYLPSFFTFNRLAGYAGLRSKIRSKFTQTPEPLAQQIKQAIHIKDYY